MSIITQVYSQSPQLGNSTRKLTLTEKSTSGSLSKTTSKITSRSFPDEERFLNLLQTMINQMNSMRSEFLLSVKDSLFDKASDQEHHELLIETIKNEEQLRGNVMKQPVPIKTETLTSNLESSNSSAFSVVDDEKKIVIENKELQTKLEAAEEDVVSLEQKNQQQEDMITRLREIVKNVNTPLHFEQCTCMELTLYYSWRAKRKSLNLIDKV